MKHPLRIFIVLLALLVVTLVVMAPVGAATGDPVLINELLDSHSGTDDTEFVEFYGIPGTSLDGLSLIVVEGDAGSAGTIDRRFDFEPSHQIGDNGFFLFGNCAGLDANYGVIPDASLYDNYFENSSLTVALVETASLSGGETTMVTGSEVVLDAIAVTDGGAGDTFYFDAPVFGPDGSFFPAGARRLVDGVDTDTVADWTLESFSLPGDNTPTGGGSNGCPTAPLVINEIMNNPGAVSDSAGEWFEIFNPSIESIDINGWTIMDDGGNSHVIDNGGPLLAPIGGYLVLGINADSGTNGGASVDYQYDNFFLANGDDEVVLVDSDGREVDRVNYDGGPNFPDPNGASMSLIDSALDNNVGENWCTSTTAFGAGDFGTPGAVNSCDVQAIEAFIHEVQGSGSSVAITDLVIVEAIVVGDYQGGDQLRGFFIQEEDEDADADPLTSEGILVYCGSCGDDVAVGDKVQVTGWPGEYFGMSQIDATGSTGVVSVVSSGNALPSPATVSLPASGSTRAELTLEPFEGMLVTFPDTLVVSEYYELARLGQLVLTVNERPRQFTDANAPSVSGYADFLDDLNTRRIILDDDNNLNNANISGSSDLPYFWPRPGLSITNYIRGGDSIDNLTGVLHWSYAGYSGTDAWRVRPVDTFNYDFTSNLARPALPADVGGSFKVASFNVLNYFATVDDGDWICGPSGDMECRGADSEAELERQREKIVSAMIAMDADVIGLMELQNDESASIQQLVDGLNAVAGAGAYGFVDTGFIGTDAIKVGFIYKTATAAPVGDFAILDTSVDPTFLDGKNRPTLAQTFEEIATGGELTVAVNHLKSKGSACDDVGDPDLNDGQANCSVTRTAAATALANWLATDPTGSGDADFLIIGDLNSYRMENPITALKAAGYTDLLDAFGGPEAYTYLFDGQLGYLDYSLANDSLSPQVTGATAWNINADEMVVFDYNDDVRDSGEASYERESNAEPIYEPNGYRSSDHDPVIVGLDLNAPPDCSEAVASPDLLWAPNHKMAVIRILGVTDPNDDPFTINIDSIFQDEPVNEIGDGHSGPDGAGVGTKHALVRSERSALGNGRVYHIFFTATDSTGLSCSGEVTVGVLLNKSGRMPVDDGPLYDSTALKP